MLSLSAWMKWNVSTNTKSNLLPPIICRVNNVCFCQYCTVEERIGTCTNGIFRDNLEVYRTAYPIWSIQGITTATKNEKTKCVCTLVEIDLHGRVVTKQSLTVSVPSLCILCHLPFGFTLTKSLGLLLLLQLFLSLAHTRRGLWVSERAESEWVQ